MLVLGACGGSSTLPASEPSDTGPAAVPTVARGEGPFQLTVSNQSFEDATIGVVVTIDGVVAVQQDFEVGGQHNFVSFDLDLEPGEHTLRATAETGATLTRTITLPASGDPRYGVLMYWFDRDDDEPYFDWQFVKDPPGFA